MILKALADYYDRMLNDPDCDVAPPGFEKKPIPFLISIDKNGRFVNLRDTRTGEGRSRIAREFKVPQGEKKQLASKQTCSGITLNMCFVWRKVIQKEIKKEHKTPLLSLSEKSRRPLTAVSLTKE